MSRNPNASPKTTTSHPDIVGAFLIISLGIVFLLNNLNLLPWNVWQTLLKFWPVLLILKGFELLVGTSLRAQLLTVLITLLVIGTVLSYSFIDTQGINSILPVFSSSSVTKTQNFPANDYPEISTRHINLNLSAGSLSLSDSDNSSILTLISDSQAQVNDNLDNQDLSFDIYRTSPWYHRSGDFDLTLGQPDLTTNLNLDLTTGLANINLDHTTLSHANLSVTTGTIQLQLSPHSLPQQLNANVGLGTIRLNLPQNAPYDLHYSVGLGSGQINNQTFHGSGTYSSPVATTSARPQFNLSVTTGSFVILSY